VQKHIDGDRVAGVSLHSIEYYRLVILITIASAAATVAVAVVVDVVDVVLTV